MTVCSYQHADNAPYRCSNADILIHRTDVLMHHKDKYSQHSLIIWSVWLNG